MKIPEISAEQGLAAFGIAEALAKKKGRDRNTLLKLMYYCSIAEDYSRMAAATRTKARDAYT